MTCIWPQIGNITNTYVPVNDIKKHRDEHIMISLPRTNQKWHHDITCHHAVSLPTIIDSWVPGYTDNNDKHAEMERVGEFLAHQAY